MADGYHIGQWWFRDYREAFISILAFKEIFQLGKQDIKNKCIENIIQNNIIKC